MSKEAPKHKSEENELPSFAEVPPFFVLRGRWAGGAAVPPSDKPLHEVFHDAIEQMDEDEKQELRKRLVEISRKYGSDGP